jgi:hypothetical protein
MLKKLLPLLAACTSHRTVDAQPRYPSVSGFSSSLNPHRLRDLRTARVGKPQPDLSLDG